jgi:hypothetical protein
MSDFDQREQRVDKQFNVGGDIVFGRADEQSPAASMPTEALSNAKAEALSAIPEDRRTGLIYRTTVMWPESPLQSPLTVTALRSHVDAVSGPRHESVFSFVRYFDCARWDALRQVYGFALNQGDESNPEFVYWQVDRDGVLVQQSTQPPRLGRSLQIWSLIDYCCHAIDYSRRFYTSLIPGSRIAISIEISGVPQSYRPPPGTTFETRLVSVSHVRWQSLDEIASQRVAIAVEFVEEILAQLDETVGHEAVSQLAQERFDVLEMRTI